MKTRFVSYKDKVLKKISSQLTSNLNAAAEYSVRYIKEKISIGQPPSKPWTPPHVLTGALRNSIGSGYGRNRFTRKIGTGIRSSVDGGYPAYLEYGTRNMLPRPYMRPSMYETRETVGKLIKANLE